MSHRLPPTLLLALAPTLAAQAPDWRPLASLGPPVAAAFDAARQRTVLVANDGQMRHWDWTGSGALERLGALSGIGNLRWLGFDPTSRELVALATNPVRVGTWNGARWSWQTPPSAPAIAPFASVTFDERRRRLVVCQDDAGTSSVLEWDGSQWWTMSAAPLPAARHRAAFAYDPIGQRCVLYGGESGGVARADCWSWDGSAWTSLAANAPPGPRSGAAATFDPTRGGLVLYGGDATSRTTWLLAGGTWTQLPTQHDPGARLGATLVADPLGLLLVGGTTDALGTAWRLTATDWVAVDTFVSAPARSFAGVAFDRARGQVVLFGGNAAPTAGTQLFDTRWRGTQPTASPALRNAPQMAWSSVEQQVLLFGGIDAGNTTLADTWSWTGTDWVQRATPMSPPARHSAMLAEDPNGGVLLFGGADGATTFGDHWHWQGTHWTQVTPALLPSPRSLGHAALDVQRQRVVLLSAAPGGATETWEWDGAAWTQRQPTVQPFPFLGSRMLAYDPQRGRVVAPIVYFHEWTGTDWVRQPQILGNQGQQAGVVTDQLRQRVLQVSAQGSTAMGVALLTATPAEATTVGHGCALGPSPGLHAMSDPTPGNGAFALELGTLVPSTPTFFVLGLAEQTQSLGAGCSLYVGQQVATTFAPASPAGVARCALPLPNAAALRGVQFLAQGAVWAPQLSLLGTVTLTAGLRLAIGY